MMTPVENGKICARDAPIISASASQVRPSPRKTLFTGARVGIPGIDENSAYGGA
jgi:hypothetical protein